MKTQNTPDQFYLLNPEKAPEFSAVLDVKDKDLIYLGKDKEKAKRILNALNMHDELVQALKVTEQKLRQASLDSGNVNYDITANEILDLIGKAEQK